MKFRVLLLVVLIPVALSSQQKTASATPRIYYAGIVKKGPNWTAEQTPEVIGVNQEHQQYIEEPLSRGILLVAGPFTDNGEIRGIYISRVEPQQQAQALCDEAPAVRSGRLTVEVHPWQVANEIIVRH